MVVVGFDRKTIERAMKLAEEYSFIYAVIGWHPVDAIDCTDEDLKWIEELAAHEKVVGIGETGLDYYWDKSPKDIQQTLFRKQIRLAQKVNLPIIIHNREATEDVIRILKEEDALSNGWNYALFWRKCRNSKTMYRYEFYDFTWRTSTFKNARKPKEVATEIPLEHLLIETDAPYLAPHPHRGKRNEPALVTLVAEEIARLKGITIEEVAEATTNNAERFFRIIDKKV